MDECDQLGVMEENSARKGGGYPNQPGCREGNALARTEKSMNSTEADGHLSIEDKLRRAQIKQREHMRAVEQRKSGGKVDPNEVRVPGDESKPIPLETNEDDQKVVLAEDDKLIVGLRVYAQNDDGSPYGRFATSEGLIDFHKQIRRERRAHIDQDGTHVRVGEVVRERTGKYLDEALIWGGERKKARRASAVIRSIMSRLMPHEAEMAAEELTPKMLGDAMDEAVVAFQKETGCEIISAAVHRMSEHDLHIHIQYTMVVRQQKKLGKYTKERKKWRADAASMAREELAKLGINEPNPSAIGAMKKRLLKAGKLDEEPLAKVIFRKVKGRRFMGNGSILGHSFRNKLNLVRIDQEANLTHLADRIISLKDEPGAFRPIAELSDSELNSRYLDLWMERIWRQTIKSKLSKKALDKVKSAGVSAAWDYVNFGSSRPKESDLERKKEELMYKEAELEWDSQIQEIVAEKSREELEEYGLMRELDLVERFLDFRGSLDISPHYTRKIESNVSELSQCRNSLSLL